MTLYVETTKDATRIIYLEQGRNPIVVVIENLEPNETYL